MASVILVCPNCVRGDHKDCMAMSINESTGETILCACQEKHVNIERHIGEFLPLTVISE
jgi:hypothetical protein